jgi:hypothetical protein
MAQQVDDTHVRVWPMGTTPVRDNKGVGAFSDRIIDHNTFFPSEIALSWQLVCSPEFVLSTYQEICGDGGCRARLRYTRRDAQGVVVADAMLSRLPSAVR